MIANACNVSVSDAALPMPSVRETIMGWFRPLTLSKVIQRTVDFETVETEIPIKTQGTVQPFSPSMLQLKPEGTRSWEWLQIHATPDLQLETEDVIRYKGTQYRVMFSNGYEENGFVEYHVVNDYQAKGISRE